MKKLIIASIIFMVIILVLSNFSYVRQAAEALDEAHKALDKGDYEEYEDWRSFAHNRISHMIITNIFFIPFIALLIHWYYESKATRR